jgi:hypothetical protein
MLYQKAARLTSPDFENRGQQNHDLDVEPILASRIYKRDPTRLDGIALHRTIPTLVWKLLPPGRFVLL